MMFKLKIVFLKFLYNFFFILSLILFFFSTEKIHAKSFDIYNIEISEPFEINFNKSKVIDSGFKKAFLELISQITNSSDQNKVKQIRLIELKEMIESFSIKEEKFINEVYNVSLDVSFNKKKILNYLEKKSVFPSTPIKKKILFIPIIIDENKRDLLIFSDNKIFEQWNLFQESFHLIEYILPTEDLEDINFIKNKFDLIEEYDFREIIKKYDLENSIIALLFVNDKNIRLLSKISINEKLVLKNKSFPGFNLNNNDQIKKIIYEMKTIYEDYWKNYNQINTSIKLPINIKAKTSDNKKITNFEKVMEDMDLIYNFNIQKFDKDYIYYRVIFNSTPNNFLKFMQNYNFYFDTQKSIWILK